jgi:hypothetical protein
VSLADVAAVLSAVSSVGVRSLLCGEIQSLKLCAFAAWCEIFFGFEGSGVALNGGRNGYFEDEGSLPRCRLGGGGRTIGLRRDRFTDLAHYPEIGGDNL